MFFESLTRLIFKTGKDPQVMELAMSADESVVGVDCSSHGIAL